MTDTLTTAEQMVEAEAERVLNAEVARYFAMGTKSVVKQRTIVADAIRKRLPEVNRSALLKALAGDTAAIESVMRTWWIGSDNSREGFATILEELSWHCMTGPFLTKLFAESWSGNRHNWLAQMYMSELSDYLSDLVDTAGTRPVGWADTVTVWRGGAGTKEQVADGWSWTTNRATACFFSGYAVNGGNYLARHDDKPRRPIVLRAEVSPFLVAHVDNSRNESEVVIVAGLPVKMCRVDGRVAEWKATGAAWRSAWNALALAESFEDCKLKRAA
jgi:hypothetical protein